MPRPTYCTPLDVYRRFNPQVTQTQLDNNEEIGSPDDEERVVSAIEEFQAEFERRARPFREVRAGAGNWIYKGGGRSLPVSVYLDHQDVVPFDASAGDAIERRTGRDTWVDITEAEGSSWVADYRMGKLTLFAAPGYGHLPAFVRQDDRFIRLRYRHGAPGGSQRKGGQTTIADSLTDTETPSTLSVDDASRIPASGTMLVDGTEYVRIDSTDVDNDTVSIASRGLRGTEGVAHDDGVTVHYCPMDVRQAIASRTAMELVLYDDWVAQIVETESGPMKAPKLDEWEQTFEQTVARYSDNYGYK